MNGLETLFARARRVVPLLLWAFCAPAFAEVPDATDRAALEQLRVMVEDERARDPEMALETVLNRVGVGIPMQSLEPKNRDWEARSETVDNWEARPETVAVDDWQAFKQFCRRVDRTEFFCLGGYSSSYAFLDLDGDGRRDLIFESSDGGIGQCSDLYIARRKGKVFDASEGIDPLYSVCMRNANTSAVWIRLKGRIYFAMQNSHASEDTITLLRPFHPWTNAPAPTLHVSYRYRLKDDAELPESFRTAFYAALDRAILQSPFGTPQTWDEDGKQMDGEPLCPLPADVQDSLRDGYYYGHLAVSNETLETIAFPLWLEGQCRVVSMQSFMGQYSREHGLHLIEGIGFFPDTPQSARSLESMPSHFQRAIDRVETWSALDVYSGFMNGTSIRIDSKLPQSVLDVVQGEGTALAALIGYPVYVDGKPLVFRPLKPLRHPLYSAVAETPTRPTDITPDEWRALAAFRQTLDAHVALDNRCYYPLAYALHDLDGDGQRDLLLESIPNSFNHCNDRVQAAYALRREGTAFAPLSHAGFYLRAPERGHVKVRWVRHYDRSVQLVWHLVLPQEEIFFFQRPLNPSTDLPFLRFVWGAPNPDYVRPCLFSCVDMKRSGYAFDNDAETVAVETVTALTPNRFPLRMEIGVTEWGSNGYWSPR
jgi:hypothetical protein